MENNIQTYEELIVLVHPLFLNCTTLNMLNTEKLEYAPMNASDTNNKHIIYLCPLC